VTYFGGLAFIFSGRVAERPVEGYARAMRRTSIWWGGFGQPFALFALFCQLCSVVLAVPDAIAAQIVSDVSVICHSEGSPPAEDHTPAHHRAVCPLCPVCLTAALAALSPSPPAVPQPARLGAAAPLPPARAGPPVHSVRLAAQPRGPPAPI